MKFKISERNTTSCGRLYKGPGLIKAGLDFGRQRRPKQDRPISMKHYLMGAFMLGWRCYDVLVERLVLLCHATVAPRPRFPVPHGHDSLCQATVAPRPRFPVPGNRSTTDTHIARGEFRTSYATRGEFRTSYATRGEFRTNYATRGEISNKSHCAR